MQPDELTPRRRTKTPEAALAALMRLCARAEKCEADACRLLRGWGVSDADARRIVDRLVRECFIDDRRYAEAFVREKVHLSGWGPYKIRQALQRKQIARETVAEALQGLDSAAQNRRLEEQLARKARSVRAATLYEYRSKLIRYGLSLGYEADTVFEAVSRLTENREP